MRRLREEERALIATLIKDKSNSEAIISQLSTMEVEEMKDGGMGSLRFKEKKTRSFGSTLAEAQVVDEDNVPISIAINLDNEGYLYELDIWKVDFSALKRFPVIK